MSWLHGVPFEQNMQHPQCMHFVCLERTFKLYVCPSVCPSLYQTGLDFQIVCPSVGPSVVPSRIFSRKSVRMAENAKIWIGNYYLGIKKRLMFRWQYLGQILINFKKLHEVWNRK